jgi:hypothetical protein
MSNPFEMTVSSVLVANMQPQSMLLLVTMLLRKQTVETQALLDSSASGEFMDHSFAELHDISLIKL